MLDREGIWKTAGEQLARDYGCRADDLKKPGIMVRKGVLTEGRRIYDHDGCFMKILCLGASAIIATAEEMVPWAEENLRNIEPGWLFEHPVLRRVDNRMRTYGHEIADVHQYYLPNGDGRTTRPHFPVIWHEAESILGFEGDERFGEAFVFGKAYPNILAVAAMEGDVVMGMAGATADGSRLWQIGIDVLPEYRGRGIATNLTALLAEEILKRGSVPFYGTAQSHIVSQRVAVQAGFLPAWAEAYTRRMAEPDQETSG